MVELIGINTKEYYKVYKELVKLTLKDGTLLPTILETIPVPEKYDFTEEEYLSLSISEESSKLRQQALMEREEKVGDINVSDGDLDMINDSFVELDNEELLSFIAKYPKYKKIIKI